MASVVFVYDTALESTVTSPTGPGPRWLTPKLRQVKVLAIRKAPARSGELKASHGASGVLRRGPYQARGSVYNTAKHAEWVHNGTTGPIRGRPYLIVPALGGAGAAMALSSPRASGRNSGFIATGAKAGKNLGQLVVLKRSVRGQQANPWLREAGYQVFGRFV